MCLLIHASLWIGVFKGHVLYEMLDSTAEISGVPPPHCHSSSSCIATKERKVEFTCEFSQSGEFIGDPDTSRKDRFCTVPASTARAIHNVAGLRMQVGLADSKTYHSSLQPATAQTSELLEEAGSRDYRALITSTQGSKGCHQVLN